jgi:hypothetical protein
VLNAIMLSVVMLNAIMMKVVLPAIAVAQKKLN